MERRDLLHIECIRTLAAFLVVFNHTGGYAWFTTVPGSAACLPAMLFSSLCKCAVPLFFMCSGALLLGKEESIAVLLKKRVLRLALVLLLFSLLTVFYQMEWRILNFSPLYFLQVIWTQPVTESYWFLYRYLGFLLALPLLRRLAQAMTLREYGYLLILMLLAGLAGLAWPLIRGELMEPSGQLILFFAEYSVLFPLLGYLLEQRLPERFCSGRGAAIAAAAGLSAMLLMCAALWHTCTRLGSWPREAGELFLGRLNFVPAAAIYYLVRYRFQRRSPGGLTSRCLRFFGRCSFGLYLLQHILLEQTGAVFDLLQPVIGAFPAYLIWTLAVCLLGSGISWLLRQIPGLRKLL